MNAERTRGPDRGRVGGIHIVLAGAAAILVVVWGLCLAWGEPCESGPQDAAPYAGRVP
jgi:hypothetical protein